MGDIGCFNGKSKVLTSEGPKTISSIQVGDMVLTHKNRYQRVTKTYCREYEGDWYKLKLKGMRSAAAWKARYLKATEEHPILVRRGDSSEWVSIRDIQRDDLVYIRSSRCAVCGKLIPFFWKLCEWHNVSELPETRKKISVAKDQGKQSNSKTSKFKHYYEDILPYAEKLKEEGYRVIPIGVAVPDIIAIKGDQVVAVELENRLPRKRKLEKYTNGFRDLYDDVLWVGPERVMTNPHKTKHFYVADEQLELVAVPVESNVRERYKSRVKVYNLEVEEDHTYIVSGVIVHNCFSFYPAKNLGCFGDGGAVVTRNKEVADRIRLLQEYGQSPKNVHSVMGYNHRLDALQAAVLRVNLKHVDFWNIRRQEVAELYTSFLRDIVRTPPEVRKEHTHVYHLYVIQVENRDALVEWLSGADIQTQVHYPIPCHKQDCYKWFENYAPSLPVAEAAAKNILSLPMHPGLDANKVLTVLTRISEFYHG
jgi:hypothetical protein